MKTFNIGVEKRPFEVSRAEAKQRFGDQNQNKIERPWQIGTDFQFGKQGETVEISINPCCNFRPVLLETSEELWTEEYREAVLAVERLGGTSSVFALNDYQNETLTECTLTIEKVEIQHSGRGWHRRTTIGGIRWETHPLQFRIRFLKEARWCATVTGTTILDKR